MKQTPFELTPKQKGLLATLSRETGKPIPALLAEALDVLQEREHIDHANSRTNGSEEQPDASTLPPRKKRLGEIAEELFRDIPEEELARLPVDGAAQHDHYIYGLPKRST